MRVVAATNADLEQRVAEGKFREDLFYRLSVIRIHVPPLRERREEIPHLSTFFLREACERLGKPGVRLSPDTLDLFDAFPLARQRAPAAERSAARRRHGARRRADHAGPAVARRSAPRSTSRLAGIAAARAAHDAGGRGREARTRDDSSRALERAAGNISETARTLGLTRRGLYLEDGTAGRRRSFL